MEEYKIYEPTEWHRYGINTSEFDRLAQAIAANLPGWNYALLEDKSYRYLVKGGYKLSLYIDSYPKYTEQSNPRVKVSGYSTLSETPKGESMYNYLGGNIRKNFSNEMTASISRGAAAIAKDIARRIIPDYTKYYDQALAAWREATDRQQRREDLTRNLAKILDAFPHWQHDNCSIYEHLELPTGSIRIDSKIGSESRYHDLSLSSLSTELLAEILQMLRAKSVGSLFEKWKEQAEEEILYTLNRSIYGFHSKDEFTQLPEIDFDWRSAYENKLERSQLYEQFRDCLNSISL